MDAAAMAGVLFDVALDTPPRNGRVELSGNGLTISEPGFVGVGIRTCSAAMPRRARAA
jgi:hypothetical protein